MLFLQKQSINIVYHNVENMIAVPNHNERNRDYSENPCLSHFMHEHDLQGNWWKKAFLAKPKHQYHVSKCGEHNYYAQSQIE